MDCQDLERGELAEKYLNGQLDPALQDDLEVHILECPRCLQTLETLESVRQDLVARAHEIRSQSLARRSRFRWQWLGAVAVFVIASLVAFLRFSHSPATEHMQSQNATGLPQPVTSSDNNPTSSSPGSAGPVKSAPSTAADRSPSPHGPKKQPPELKTSPPASEQGGASAIAHSGPPEPIPPVGINDEHGGGEVATHAHESGDQGSQTIAGGSTTSATAVKKSNAESEEVARERFRLGIVQPPPYTFSGVAHQKPRDGKIDKSALAQSGGASPKANQPNSGEVGRGLFQKAMESYVDQHYMTAANFLEDAARADPRAPDINFFLGICRLMLAKPEDAIPPLKAALADSTSPFVQSAHYYLAKAYLQTDELVKAEVELQAAAATPGKLRSEANSLLARVQALRALQQQQNALGPNSKPD